MKRVQKHLELFKVLASCKKSLRKAIIDDSSREIINAICEIIDNFLHNNLKITSDQLLHLSPYKKTLRRLVKKDTLQNKKKILNQKGGFLQFLIPAVVTTLGALISDAIKSDV